jgi:predicted MFS family arabinose efflux permease
MATDRASNPSGNMTPWPSEFRGWITVSIFFVIAILSYTDRLIFSLIVDPVRNSLGISDFQIGLAQGTSFALIYALAGLPAGRLADIVNRRRLLLMGTFIWSAGTVACGLATGVMSLMSARILVAAGEAILAPTAMSMISDLFAPERRGRPMAVFLSGMNVGSGLALVIGGGVLTLAQSGSLSIPWVSDMEPWRTTLILIGLFGLPALCLLLLLREPQRISGRDQQARPLRLVMKEMLRSWRRLLPLLMGLAGLATADFTLIYWVPTLLSRHFHVPTSTISNEFGLVVIFCGCLGSLVGGWVADRFFISGGNAFRLRIAALLALSGSLAVVLLMGASANVVMVLSGLWLFVSAVATICGIATAQDMVPADAKGLCISFIAMGNVSLGLGIGAALPGAMTSMILTGPSGLLWSVTGIAVAFALGAGILFHSTSRALAQE